MTPGTYNDLLIFKTKILDYFNELKTLYNYDQGQKFILFNNKDVLVNGIPIFLSEWFKKGILSINDLLNESNQRSGKGKISSNSEIIGLSETLSMTEVAKGNPVRFNSFTPTISILSLLTVCHTLLLMLVLRIWC